MFRKLAMPIAVAFAVTLSAGTVSAGHCGGAKFSCCKKEPRCKPQCCFLALRKCCETCYKKCCKTVYEKEIRTCTKTVYEKQWQERTCTVMKPVYETHYKECTYTVCKPVWEEKMVERKVTCCKLVKETCYKECTYTVCKPICETVMKEVKRVCCKPVCETKTVKETVCEKQKVCETIPGKTYCKTVRDSGCWVCDPCTGKRRWCRGEKRTVECKAPDRTCVRTVWVTKEVERQVKCIRYVREEKIEKVPCTRIRYEKQCVTKKIPYTVCKRVLETKVVCEKVRCCKMVKETCTKKVPYTTCKMCPTEVKTKVCVCVPKQVECKVEVCVPKKVVEMVPYQRCRWRLVRCCNEEA